MQFHACGETVLVFAAGGYSGVAGCNALDPAVFVKQDLRRRETRIDFRAEVLGLLAQPAAQAAKADDVVAFVVHGARHHESWNLQRLVLVEQNVDVVIADRRIQWRAILFPVGEQFVECAWFEYRAGKDMGTHFRAFLDHADAEIARQLLEPAGCRQPCRSCADDHDIKFHRFSGHWYSPLLLDTHARRKTGQESGSTHCGEADKPSPRPEAY